MRRTVREEDRGGGRIEGPQSDGEDILEDITAGVLDISLVM